MGPGPAEPAVSALPGYKWAILITILQAGPRAGKLAAVRTDQTSHLLPPNLFHSANNVPVQPETNASEMELKVVDTTIILSWINRKVNGLETAEFEN